MQKTPPPWDESEPPAFPPMPFDAHDDEVWTGGMRTGGMKTPAEFRVSCSPPCRHDG